MTAHILVVIDDPAQRRQIKATVEALGHFVELADGGRAALDFLRHRGREVKAIILDLNASGMETGEFLAALSAMDADVPVIVETGQDSIDAAVEAMRAGAYDFVLKPASQERISSAIANALKSHRGEGTAARISRRSRAGNVSFNDIIAASSAMERVIDLARRAAQSTIPVVLEGEAGVGKEMVARAIHSASDRSSKPFVIVNCDAVGVEAIEEHLFGDTDGEADTSHNGGKYRAADGGTLFLNEIGALPIGVQARLLQVMEHGETDRGGSAKRRKNDVRLISATHKNLIEEVKLQRFREDLYYRLNVYPIMVPALRRRKDDVPYLARAFVERFSQEQRLPKSLTISPAALALLTSADWPGNVRELENVIFRAVILASGSELNEVDFPQIAAFVDHAPAPVSRSASYRSSNSSAPSRPLDSYIRETARSEALETGEPGMAANMIVSTDQSGNVRKLSDVEEELIRFALKFYRGQMSQVARKLGIGRSTLYRKLKDYGIDPENPQKKVA